MVCPRQGPPLAIKLTALCPQNKLEETSRNKRFPLEKFTPEKKETSKKKKQHNPDSAE